MYAGGGREGRKEVERADGKVKISWRSIPGINVAQVAVAFGGGGHAAAAGAEVAGTLDEVEALVLPATREAIRAAQLLQRELAASAPTA